jgi:hypothetical protein
MYSVIFTAIDRAGNEKSARTLFFYDDSSHVQLVKDKTIQVKESTKVTGYVWISVDNPILNVIWPGKFQNKNHYTQRWLESVKSREHVDVEYDDHYGKRKTTAEKHVQGIKCWTNYIHQYRRVLINLLLIMNKATCSSLLTPFCS